MSTGNKKNLASQALLEMETIRAAIKEESKSTIKTMLNEAIKDALRESIEDDEYDIEDDDNATNDTNDGEFDSTQDTDTETQDSEDATSEDEKEIGNEDDVDVEDGDVDADVESDTEGEEEGSDWSEFDKYKVGDDTYDLSGEEDYDSVVKVYKLLKGDDQVLIKKNDGKITLKDNQTDTEYVIDLGGDEEDDSETKEPLVDGEEDSIDSVNESEDIAGLPNDMEDDEEQEELNENKNKKTKKTMKENKEVIFEVDLGYTDNYQDKDPIQGLTNNEPSKSGKSWHKGVPTGTEKPWAGKSKDKSKPFAKEVNEDIDECGSVKEEVVDEAAKSTSSQSVAKTTHTPTSEPRKEHSRKVEKLVHTAKGYAKENKELKEAIKELRASLNEAYLVNVNLGKITKLFLENTTTHAEKIEIINRFNNESKTVEQAKALYESINKQLKKGPSAESLIENNGKVSTAQPLNENKDFGKTKDVLEVINFMNRMNLC